MRMSPGVDGSLSLCTVTSAPIHHPSHVSRRIAVQCAGRGSAILRTLGAGRLWNCEAGGPPPCGIQPLQPRSPEFPQMIFKYHHHAHCSTLKLIHYMCHIDWSQRHFKCTNDDSNVCGVKFMAMNLQIPIQLSLALDTRSTAMITHASAWRTAVSIAVGRRLTRSS